MGSLSDKAFVPFCRMIPRPAEDGFGGYGTLFAEGEPFRGAAIPLNENELDTGPVSSPGGRYRITAERSAPLGYGDTVRRLTDGALFRITGEVCRTPEGAGIELLSAPAERIGAAEDGLPDLSGHAADGGETSDPAPEAEQGAGG